jgi:predicted transposase/invertase (TIGR01784 family)
MSERVLISFDWALKSILRQKDNFDILEGFLTDLLSEKIEIIELIESEGNKDAEKAKLNRVDLKAKDSTGKEIIVEIQYYSELDYLKRVYFGAAKSLTDSMAEGYRYDKVKKIISVSIVYFGVVQNGYIAHGKIRFDDMRGNAVSVKGEEDLAEYYLIQPTWFDDNIKDKLDEWIYMFKHSKVRDGASATNIEKAADKLDRLKMPENERRAYRDFKDEYGIQEAQLLASREEGKEENKQQMIDAMKKSGMSDEEIERVIKLSESKIIL